jgi:ubiquinone/menaquinone biosynthesis C-methylase UbiE
MQKIIYFLFFISIFSCRPNEPFKQKNNDNQDNFKTLVKDYENENRVIWQKPDLVMNTIGNLENKVVADIGAGTGYFSFRMLPKAKKVIAIDIDKRFINFMDSIKSQLPESYRNQFESRLATVSDPKLKDEEANAVLIVNTYIYIENRVEYLKILKKGMAPNAKLIIIDFKKKNIPVGPPQEVKIAESQVEEELTNAGFENIQIDEKTLDYQYIVTAFNR